MESPIGDASRGLYGETVGNPVSQVFFNFGWHNLFCSRAVRLRLTPPPASVAQAERILAKYNEGVFACTPLEVSRGNADCTPIAFGNILRRRVPTSSAILFGCAPSDVAQLTKFIGAMNLSHAI